MDARFDARAPDSPWCGFATVGGDEVTSLVLVALCPDRGCVTVTRDGDGTYRLATATGHVVERGLSLRQSLGAMERPGVSH